MTHRTARILITGIIFLLGMESGIALNLQPVKTVPTSSECAIGQSYPMYPPIKLKPFVGIQQKLAANIPLSAVTLSRNVTQNKWGR